MPDWLVHDGDDIVLRLRIQPKASRDAFVRTQPDYLQVSITAPPVDGKANTHLVAWLAKEFKVGKSAIRIEAGMASRLKRVRISAPQRLPAALDKLSKT